MLLKGYYEELSRPIVCGLVTQKYPEIPVPNKVLMPRPVNAYFKTWEGSTRPEFRNDINNEQVHRKSEMEDVLLREVPGDK